MVRWNREYAGYIDQVVDVVGRGFAWLIVPLVLAIVFDVVMRYVFSAPTIWSFDLSYMLGGMMMLIGLSYVHKQRRHVRVDILIKCLSPRMQTLLNLLFRMIFFFPLVGVLIKISFDKALYAWQIGEVSRLGMWHPSMIPFKTVMFLAFVLLMLEGIGQFINEVRLVREGWHND
ncbi:MAG: TRAP transporter small permease subunit [Candidatus Thorarchaeota archaeon]